MSRDPDQSPSATRPEGEIRGVLERARNGDAAALPELRAVLDDHPEIWQHYGALATHARQAWIDLIGGTDLALKLSLARQVESMKLELAGPGPSPLETLLVERIVACWLQACHADAAAAQAQGLSPKQATFVVKRQDSAHRRYLMAIATLALTRRLLAATVDESARRGKLTSPSGQSRDVKLDGLRARRPIARRGPGDPPSRNDLVMEFAPPAREPAPHLRPKGPRDC